MIPEFHMAAAVAVFLATYAVIAAGKLPGFFLDRAGAAMLGAALMLRPARFRLRTPTGRSISARFRSCSG